MRVFEIIDEDFINYHKASMFISSIQCSGKCYKDLHLASSICQNSTWRNKPITTLADEDICKRYLENNITESIVIGGLEPFEQFDELLHLIDTLRTQFNCTDDVVIYTGYNKDEIIKYVNELKFYPNILIKFGRYIPDSLQIFDDTLKVYLSSSNQYAEKVS